MSRGSYINHNGYRLIYVPDHIQSNKRGYAFEHRVVMSNFLNRRLTDSEKVHHINGNKLDNRLENLQLVANQSEHMSLHHRFCKHGHEVNVTGYYFADNKKRKNGKQRNCRVCSIARVRMYQERKKGNFYSLEEVLAWKPIRKRNTYS